MNKYRYFDVDRSVIANFIHSQNGTLATAIRELIMNGIDKGSKKIEIKISETGFEVIDFGSGFESEEYIEKFFGCFGTPHKAGDAKFGIFRIGRGQIMKFGHITWHSNEFKMHTDVNKLGMGYELEVNKDDVFVGCRVSGKLYSPLSNFEIRSAIGELESFVRYLSEEVTINKKVCSVGEDNIAWDYEDEHVKAIWKNSGDGIRIYSQGVYVKTLNAYSYGSLHGDVVSKKALTLNMARNELSEDDDLWVHISSVIRKKSNDEAKKKMKARKLDEVTRIMLIKQFLYGEVKLKDIVNHGLIKDFRGHSTSISAFSSSKIPVTVMKDGYKKEADAIAFQKTAFVFSQEEIEIWNASTLSEMMQKIAKSAFSQRDNRVGNDILFKPIIEIDLLAVGIDSSMKILKNNELSPREAAARDALKKGSKVAAREFSASSEDNFPERKVVIGECIRARAWTDGMSYVAFDKKELKLLEHGIEGAVEIALILCHEYVHEESDTETHEHDLVFYQNFHDKMTASGRMLAGKIANAIYKEYHRSLVKRTEKLPKKAIGELPFDILRDVYEYEGRSEGKKGLSDLSKLLIDALGIKCTVNRGVVKIVSSHGALYQKTNRGEPERSLLKAAKDNGFTPKEVDEINGDYEDVIDMKRQAKLECLQQWAKAEGHDHVLMEEIIMARYHFSIDLLLQLICLDRNSDIVYFSRDTQSFKNEEITEKGVFNRYGFEHWLNREIVPRPEDLATNSEAIEDKLLIEMKKVLLSIRDKDLREAMSKLIFTEESRLKMTRFH